MKFTFGIRKLLVAIVNLFSIGYAFLLFQENHEALSISFLILTMIISLFIAVFNFLNLRNWIVKLLYIAIIILLCFGDFRFSDRFTIYCCLLILSWIIYVGFKSILRILAIPFRLAPKSRGEGANLIPGVKWECSNQIVLSNGKVRKCDCTRITFKNNAPYPFDKDCPYSEDGSHNWEPKGKGSNVSEMLGNLMATIGFIIGILAVVISLFIK